MLNISSRMSTRMQLSLLNEGGLDLHTGQSSPYSSKPSDGQWMEKNQIFEEEQKASVTTHSEDKDVNVSVLQRENSNGNKRVYDCPVCLKRFGAPSKLKRHCLIHTNQRPFQCSLCSRAFRERYHLNIHIKTHTNPVKRRTPSLQSYKDNCSQTSKSRLKPFPKNRTTQNDTSSTHKQKAAATDVIKTNSGATKGHWCPICFKCFKAPSKLKRHILIHTGEKPFKCSVCPKAFREKSHLKVHKCKVECNSILSDWQAKGNTVKYNAEEGVVSTAVDDSNDNQVRCSLPDVITPAGKRMFPVSKSSDRMCMPQLKKNSGNQCEICLKKFSYPSKLTRHLFVHFDAKSYTCTICRRSFKQANYLHKHLKVHTGKSNNKSSLCRVPQKHEAKPPKPGALKSTNNCRPDGVNVCLPQILDSLENKKHRKLECRSKLKQNVPLTESNISTLEIKSSDALNNAEMQIRTSSPGHLKRKQKGVNQCSICLKIFPYPSKLTRHIFSHTDSRPFECHMCLKSFRYQSHLQLHLRTHKKKGWNKIAGHLEQDHTVSFSNAQKSKDQDVQISSKDGAEDSATVHQDPNMVIESQKMSGDSSVYLQDSLLNEGGLDLHTEQSPGYSSKPPESQWMEENKEIKEEQKASVTTQNKDKDVNVNMLQRKNSNGNKRVYDCPVCQKRFGAPSKLKRHCLIHTNQRPFQCSLCSRAFRERYHLNIHIKTHTNPVKRRTPSLQSYKDNSVSCDRASRCRLKPFPKHLTAQNNDSLTEKQQSAVHHDENMVIESQKINCGSSVYLQLSLLNEGGLDLHTGQSSAYSTKPSESKWMEENKGTEEEQKASVTTQNEDKDVNVNMLQRKNSNGNKRVYDCPVCLKRFGAPSKLKRHCLIHTNQRPFQCSLCSRAFRERYHLNIHIKTHTNPVKRRTPSLQSYSVSCDQTSKSRLNPFPKHLTAQNYTSLTEKQQSTVHHDENMVIEDMASQKMSGDGSHSNVYLQDYLLNEGGLDLHTEQSSTYFSKPSEGQWMEEQKASVTTHSEDKDVNANVLQKSNSNGSKRVYDCPVCKKRFGAPSKLKRHCLIHTNQRPFQCSLCSRAFRERYHLNIHIKTHTNPVKRRTPSLQSYRDNSVSCDLASKSRLKPYPEHLSAQNDTSSTDKQKSTVHQVQYMVITDDTPFQNMSGDCNDSDLDFSKTTSPLEKSEVVSRCSNESVWTLTDKTDILLDGKEASDIVPFGRMSDCPPKTESSLHHCAYESRIEEKWAHHMDDIKDCVFVNPDTVKCVPDSDESSSCKYQQKADVTGLREIVVVGLLDFQDPGECFTKPPHDLPICPDCSQCFPSIRSLYAHKCANRYSKGNIKKSHQCDICLKFFSAPSKLKRHYVTHTGQRPFQCTQCQKSFTQSHYLKTHTLSHR
ncbi:zinc finger protein Xfin [Carassius auratus]|uniref:Zinc finger protein Xfin-like n=1 Tax=Carassius auratus TaxID=7957 RepID=A0A6P6LWW2_CARAU|nr:zinc finger protein Xfin-like [Carassius auratus]XP_026088928.1 zinc finger protein Xfin-like [Carassius auratus]